MGCGSYSKVLASVSRPPPHPHKDKGCRYGGRKTKAAGPEVWIGPELLQGDPPRSPMHSRCPYLRG